MWGVVKFPNINQIIPIYIHYLIIICSRRKTFESYTVKIRYGDNVVGVSVASFSVRDSVLRLRVVCTCVCVCVREREREREGGESERACVRVCERGGGEGECVCVRESWGGGRARVSVSVRER